METISQPIPAELFTRANPGETNDWPDYPSGPYYTPEYVVGGFGGSKFLSSEALNGLLVKRVEVWYDSKALKGVRLTYTDDSSTQAGQQKNEYAKLDINPGEIITSLKLWGNGVGTRTGRVEMTTNTGKTLAAGKDVSGQNTYVAPTGSGILVGYTGRGGQEIDMLGFIFFDNVSSVQLGDVHYSGAPEKGSAAGINVVALQQASFGPFNTETNWRFANAVTRTSSQSWTKSSTVKYYALVTVKADIFGIGGEATAGWERTTGSESSTEVTTEISLSWDTGGVLPAEYLVNALATVSQGQLDLPYSGQLTISFNSGNQVSVPVKGLYTNVVYGRSQAKGTLIPPSN
ncbi:jacalin-like lectin [Spirosoma pollinicola]|uniref:Jacalin-type lectin domain-containing protein n=1 Tax=Spirosoma pollinicola TaxID=2057025 RepID=A0A2K8ZAC4_9BACT|nr:jacalin-like lectin [Spirosoma pollinicola]AUD06800.1 hypothetical protein CWM47_36105 [Spirosoma pollinicola]